MLDACCGDLWLVGGEGAVSSQVEVKWLIAIGYEGDTERGYGRDFQKGDFHIKKNMQRV